MKSFRKLLRDSAPFGLVAGTLLAGTTMAWSQNNGGTLPDSLPAAATEAGKPAEAKPDPSKPPADVNPCPPRIILDCKDGGDKPKPEECVNPWQKVPPVRIFPRLGTFPIPPSGPGYYSFRDFLRDEWREKPPNYPYPPQVLIPFSFFDADFRYLDNPKNTQHDLFDPLHRCYLNDDWLFSTGGEARWRHNNEVNSRLSGVDNNYDLLRVRVFGDLWYHDEFRAYVEFHDAGSMNQALAPLPSDVNKGDLLNAFVDVKLANIDCHPAYLRVGRQELLLGSERLLSPLDWGNVRRTFQGVRSFRQGEKFDVDLFWVQPVVPNPAQFDSVNNNVNFAGAWTTYRPKKGTFLDAYYLFLDNTLAPALPGTGGPRATNIHTLGTRYCGDENHFLWDMEYMLQFGERGAQDVLAGSVTVSGGYNFHKRCWNPTMWVCYDYATGDRNPGTGGQYTTFNQLFPFGHYYLGWIDLVGRQNIHDFNVHYFLYPTKWMQFWLQYHRFYLDSSRDALYSAGGVPLRRSPTGVAGRDVGQEFDFIVNLHLGPHSDVLVGYTKLFQGPFLKQTGPGPDPETLYLMYNFRW